MTGGKPLKTLRAGNPASAGTEIAISFFPEGLGRTGGAERTRNGKRRMR